MYNLLIKLVSIIPLMGNIVLNFKTYILFRKLHEMYPKYPNRNLEKTFKRDKKVQKATNKIFISNNLM